MNARLLAAPAEGRGGGGSRAPMLPKRRRQGSAVHRRSAGSPSPGSRVRVEDKRSYDDRSGGRPGRLCGYVQRRLTSCRCQRNSVAGRTARLPKALRGSARPRAARIARSTGRSCARRGCRRRIASSCRSTRISSSFDRSEGCGPLTHPTGSLRELRPSSADSYEPHAQDFPAAGLPVLEVDLPRGLSPPRQHLRCFQLAKRPQRRRVAPWPASWRRSASGSGSGRSPSRTGSRGEARRKGPHLIWDGTNSSAAELGLAG
jgi:hypothetical protein